MSTAFHSGQTEPSCRNFTQLVADVRAVTEQHREPHGRSHWPCSVVVISTTAPRMAESRIVRPVDPRRGMYDAAALDGFIGSSRRGVVERDSAPHAWSRTAGVAVNG